ncbi:hypothetical protein BSK63_23570 [Paenibacillus odorifer]|uniref:hypothetical protein n=1 Tax=Paenibacillus odorifer TaxID=189426 RepID=UPI00096C47D8|nr:hypothetical protein [Paenibacillus odorifer]OME28893.1 hypothetical protein BSK63_23570 [Paenibacillus odorifer]
MVLPFTAVASADSNQTDVNTTVISAVAEDEPIVINLGKHGKDEFLALNPLPPVEWKDASGFLYSGLIAPRSTDGQNIDWNFSDVNDKVWTSALPIHRSGSITIKLVQTTGTSTKATVNYQFITDDYTIKSDVVQVVGNISSPATTITITNVPKGTALKPLKLLIGNHSYNASNIKVNVQGNGYTIG